MRNHQQNGFRTESRIKDFVSLINQESSLEEKIGAVLIDMQPGFLKKIAREERKTLLYSHLELLDFLLGNNMPLAVLEYKGYGLTKKSLRKKIANFPVSSRVFITKNDDDGFTNPALNEALRYWQIKKLILMGINASFCVKKTGRNALSLGYSIYTARQLIANSKAKKGDFERDVPFWYETNGIYFQNYQQLIQAI